VEAGFPIRSCSTKEHDPEKGKPVFRQDHAPLTKAKAQSLQLEAIALPSVGQQIFGLRLVAAAGVTAGSATMAADGQCNKHCRNIFPKNCMRRAPSGIDRNRYRISRIRWWGAAPASSLPAVPQLRNDMVSSDDPHPRRWQVRRIVK
jgi:hypothetical protein